MYRPAAAEVTDLSEEPMPAASGETLEIVTVLRALRARDSSIVPLTDSGRLVAVDTQLGAGPVAWAVEAARDAWTLGVTSTDGAQRTAEGTGLDYARFHESLLLDILLQLADGEVADDDPADLQDLARDVGHGGGALADLRGAQRYWSGLLLDHAVGLSAGAQVLRDITVVVGARFDRLADGVVMLRSAERTAGHTPEPERHRQLVESLVSGAPVDPGWLRTELGLDLGRPHVALVLTRPDGSGPQGDELDVAVGCVARALGARVALRHEAVDGALWVWLGGTESASPLRLTAAGPGAPELVASESGPSPVRVGVGSSRVGPGGLRRSHLEARDAHQFAAGARGPVVRYEDVAFAALLRHDPERARWFVTTQLGPLAGEDEPLEELRRTLSAYYTAGMRLASTATALHLHRNTLVNRLHRIEKLLGRAVTERVAETHSALLLIDDPGSPVSGG